MVQLDFGQGEGRGEKRGLSGYSLSLCLLLVLSSYRTTTRLLCTGLTLAAFFFYCFLK